MKSHNKLTTHETSSLTLSFPFFSYFTILKRYVKNFPSDWLSLRPRAKVKQKRRQGESGYPITPSRFKNCLQKSTLPYILSTVTETETETSSLDFNLYFTLLYFILFYFQIPPIEPPAGKGEKKESGPLISHSYYTSHSFLNHLNLSFIFNLIHTRSGALRIGAPPHKSVLHLFTPRAILIIPN